MMKQKMDVESIFAEAVEIEDRDKRTQFLNEVCADDAQLRARVEALLRSHNDAGSFLDKPPAEFVATLAASEFDTVDEGAGEISPNFLQPTDKAGCLGTLDDYEVVEVIGRGGMGLVLKAHDPKLNRTVAIKVMAPELAANPTAVKRFLREAQAAAAVSHDHVVTIHAIDETHRPPFIVMECIVGQSLQEKIDHCGSLELKEVLRIGMQTADGLAAAHKQGLVHRDIKPANILLENGVERVKITDFGLARAVDDVSVTQTGQIAGTPQFMSPEQAQGQPIDARSDLFSLGSVLYTMCTGRAPFRADNAVAMLRRVTDDDPRPICEVNAEIPDWLEAIIFKLLEKNPDDRFRSAEEVGELLSGHLAYLQHPATSPKPVSVASSRRAGAGIPSHDKRDGIGEPSYRRRWPIVVGLFALLAIVAAVVVYVQTDNGMLEIRSPGTDVKVVIRKDGKIVEIYDDKHDQTPFIRLRSGKYEFELQQDDTKQFHLSKDRCVVSRGEREIVEIRHVNRVPFNSPKVAARQLEPEFGRLFDQMVAAEKLSGRKTPPDRENKDEMLKLYRRIDADFLKQFTGKDNRLDESAARTAIRAALWEIDEREITLADLPRFLAEQFGAGKLKGASLDVTAQVLGTVVRHERNLMQELLIPIDKPSENRIVIRVSKTGEFSVAGKTHTSRELRKVLENALKKNPHIAAMIQSERETQHKHVVEVIELCTGVGIIQYSLSAPAKTRPPVVSLMGDGVVTLDGNVVTEYELSRQLKSMVGKLGTTEVQFEFTKDVDIDLLAKTEYSARRIGIEKISVPTWFDGEFAARVEKRRRLIGILRDVGLGFHNYNDTHKVFPPTATNREEQFDDNGKPLLSWRVHLLPYLSRELGALHDKFRLNEPWNSKHNLPLLDQIPDVYQTIDKSNETTIMMVAGPGTAYEGKHGLGFREFLDGTAYTILAVAAGDDKSVPWTKPQDLDFDPQDPVSQFGTIDEGAFLAAFCDGHVESIRTSLHPKSIKSMLTRAASDQLDGGVIPRWERWNIRFKASGIDEVARQLDFFKIELGALTRKTPKIEYATKLSNQEPTRRDGKREDEFRLYFMINATEGTDFDQRQLLQRAEIDTRDKYIAQFYPKATEAILAKVEKEHAKETPIEKIKKTVFEVRAADDGFELHVVEQVLLD